MIRAAPYGHSMHVGTALTVLSLTLTWTSPTRRVGLLTAGWSIVVWRAKAERLHEDLMKVCMHVEWMQVCMHWEFMKVYTGGTVRIKLRVVRSGLGVGVSLGLRRLGSGLGS